MINLLFKYVKSFITFINNKFFVKKLLPIKSQFGSIAIAGQGTIDIPLDREAKEVKVFFVKSLDSVTSYELKESVLKFEALKQDEEYLIRIEWEVPSSSIMRWEAQF